MRIRNEADFHKIADAKMPLLYKWLRLEGIDNETAEDMLAEAFSQLWRARERVDGDRNINKLLTGALFKQLHPPEAAAQWTLQRCEEATDGRQGILRQMRWCNNSIEIKEATNE